MLAGDPDDHLVEMPTIARPRTAPPQPACDNRPEFQHPAAHRLVRDIEPALGEKLLHIAVAQGETQVEPHSMLYETGEKRWRRYEISAIASTYPRSLAPAIRLS